MAAAAPAENFDEVKRFDGRVFHVHCDPMISAESLAFDFPSTGENQFGTIVPEIFLVISSPDLLAAVQKQLQNHLNGTYNAQSVTFQLGDAEGALGSEMISENLASRLVHVLNIVRNQARDAMKQHLGAPASASSPHCNLTPTAAGLRLYPKLPEVKGNKAETDRKVRELAVKYGAVPGEDGEARDMSKLAVTIKINIFGFYKGAFYLNYRLVAPFRAKDKPEILAEKAKAPRKRNATGAGRKPRAPAAAAAAGGDAEGEGAGDADAAAASSSAGAGAASAKRKAEAPGAPKKRVRPVGALEAAATNIDPSDYANEDDLALAYVKAGIPLRQATVKAMQHFAEAEDASAPTFTAVSRTLSTGGAGNAAAGAGAGGDDSDDE